MSAIQNCGYISSYFKSKIPSLNSFLGYDHNFVIKTLSTFDLEEITHKNTNSPPSQIEKQLIFVLDNIISRGFPTYNSIFLERQLARLIDGGINILETTEQGTIKFSDSITDPTLNNLWHNALSNALIITDLNFNPNSIFEKVENQYNTANNVSVSLEEREFFCEILPRLIGLNISQLFEPQRKVDTMLPENLIQNYIGQRVDFALETVDYKLVVEIDGDQHFNDPIQFNLDLKRRTDLKDNGWKIIEIAATEIRDGLKPVSEQALRAIISQSIYLTKLNLINEIEFSNSAKKLVRIPLYAARLHKIILLALKKGYLNFNSSIWNLCIIEEDIPYSELAIDDFNLWLSNLCSLFNIFAPKINFRSVRIGESLLPATEDEIGIFISLKNYLGDSDKNIINTSGLKTIYLAKSSLHFISEFKISSAKPFEYEIGEKQKSSLLFLLQSIFRKEIFWEGQTQILKRSLSLKPVIGLLPTGAGKSLTYQLSALLQPGITFIVDPLRSLMFDQADNLRDYCIENIQFINSEQSALQRANVINEMSNGKYQMVFIAPERFQDNNFRNSLTQLTVSFSVPYLVIDEAHCVSEWGHDFRTSYLNVAKTSKKYCTFQNYSPTVLALTGTASYSVLTDVQREIGIDEEEAKIYPQSFEREELLFDIYNTPSANKIQVLNGLIRNHLPDLFNTGFNYFFEPHDGNTFSGLIFVPWTNHNFGSRVRDQLQNNLGIPVGFYSGSIPKYFLPNSNTMERNIQWNKEKRRIQNDFKNNIFPVLVSTKAFGMGIDKPNVRYTIHFGIPSSLEAFYQEAGRAGRDKKDSHCLIIFSDDNPALADQYLDINLSAHQLRLMKEQKQWPAFDQEGDVHRMLYFHMNAFQGEDLEIRNLHSVLLNRIYPVYNGLQTGQTHQMVIPRTDEIDKSIYRLSILGIVEDYTIDWNARQYTIHLKKLSEYECLENFRTYLARYRTPDYVRNALEDIQLANGANILEKCLGYIVRFAYNEIEKKRRAALKTILEVARSASRVEAIERNDHIREQLLAYLEKSVFTDLLLEMVRTDDHNEWWKIIDLVTDIDLSRQLLGSCRRTIESYPDYPGLYILSAFSRLSLPNQSIEQINNDFNTGLNLIRDQLDSGQQEEILVKIINYYQIKAGNINETFGEMLLELIPSRKIARLLYTSLPEISQIILLSELTKKIKIFNNYYLGD